MGQWENLVRRVMKPGYSWADSCVEYLRLYSEALRKREGVQALTA